jgi:hypothetical protein
MYMYLDKDKEKQIPYLLIVLSIVFAIIGWFLANGKSKTQYVRLHRPKRKMRQNSLFFLIM